MILVNLIIDLDIKEGDLICIVRVLLFREYNTYRNMFTYLY
jgi:hypothetical protein